MKNTILAILVIILTWSCSKQSDSQTKISLNGEWDITKTGSFDKVPSSFNSKVPVPGLADLAVPALDTSHAYDNGVYWHKTTFILKQNYPDLINLKIGKAKYHARVYVNGQFVGEHLYCFTSAEFNIRDFLNNPGEENELIIGVGTYNNMPDTIIWGKDFEKLTYIPGIYDEVSLNLSDYPHIKKIQTVPIIEENKLRVVADIDQGGKNRSIRLRYQVKELQSGKVVAEGKSSKTDFEIAIPDARLWSPEDPFLYELKLFTVADEQAVRFGMRSFSFDPETGRALLNGQTYFMRGTNVCILRFFEDPDRGLLPWTNDWIIKLHHGFKDMHWNSVRYCIGLPPERWYDIADSLGILIQNEYPVWTGGAKDGFTKIYPGVTADRLANEYRNWMSEHWNHPSVVIWDAQNESVSDITGEAIGMVRDLDLSNRPWENGWSTPQSASDPIESHPYLFIPYRRNAIPTPKGALSDLLNEVHIPGNDVNNHMPPAPGKRHPNPIIINEYEWLWLNRDGSTTTLTDRVYEVVFGKNITAEERIHHYNRYLGMITEYWRAHRLCAGVLEFCGLGYSRPAEPRGQTSDHFIDIKNLVYEPEFLKYVKPAFSPVGIMINYWEKKATPGEILSFDLYAVNDVSAPWTGSVSVGVEQEGRIISSQKIDMDLPALERQVQKVQVTMPSQKGHYKLVAEIDYLGQKVISIRDIEIS